MGIVGDVYHFFVRSRLPYMQRYSPHSCNALHADFLFPSQLTYPTHTKCPLPLYMNNINVFSSSPPSWKITSVRRPLTLAHGSKSM